MSPDNHWSTSTQTKSLLVVRCWRLFVLASTMIQIWRHSSGAASHTTLLSSRFFRARSRCQYHRNTHLWIMNDAQLSTNVGGQSYWLGLSSGIKLTPIIYLPISHLIRAELSFLFSSFPPSTRVGIGDERVESNYRVFNLLSICRFILYYSAPKCRTILDSFKTKGTFLPLKNM